MEKDWETPPLDARIRSYWWWINGNVTKEAITHDLEEMKAKGWGGALICDADGSSQDGNDRAPAGPVFLSPEWRELYKHALREANRLGLEMSLNIQSGWNLGGPMVTADDAAKKLTWSETVVKGPGTLEVTLPEPKSRDNYYRDVMILAYPLRDGMRQAPANISASSEQPANPARQALDGNEATFWVSNATEPGQGPTPEKPQWLQLEFEKGVVASRLTVQGRPGYGPKNIRVSTSANGRQWKEIAKAAADKNGQAVATFSPVTNAFFRVVFQDANDPKYPQNPRNVQVTEVRLQGPDGAELGRSSRQPLQNWQAKGMHRALSFSAPDTTPLFEDFPATPGEEDASAAQVVDLTRMVDKNGVLRWSAPAGSWQVLRFGCTIGDHSRVSTCSQGWEGFAVDVLDAGALERYWDAVVTPLINDAGPLAGKTLRFLHTDSWEVEAVNWTPTLREEFRKRRGYDLLPYFPILAGRIIESREIANRFLHDFRKTLGDLAIDHHYRIYRDRAHAHGLQIHPESGGPHAVPIDAQRCLGFNDAPMSEFWAWSWRHRVGDENRFFVKQPASAAHTYGRKLVLAEGFTTIGPHWQETVWDNLKPSFDKAICEGLNLLFWHAFVCSPKEMGIPGQQYFAGTHFNPNTTWWNMSGPFIAYVNRCQALMQSGIPVSDVLYYYGDHVPNFARLKKSDPANILPGYDYDVITEEAILERLSVKNGRLVLPNGVNYRLLVLPARDMISLPVLRKLEELAKGGAVITGTEPKRAATLKDYPKCDQEVSTIGARLWQGVGGAKPLARSEPARALLQSLNVAQDFEVVRSAPDAMIDYIHRQTPTAEIYFVANRSNRVEELQVAFRVTGRAPEFWDPVTGSREFARAYAEANGRTTLPLRLEPCGSVFVVFRSSAAERPSTGTANHLTFAPVQPVTGTWEVAFDTKWGGPGSASFGTLVSWTARPEPGIKHYSGTATYRLTFDCPSAGKELYLDLGELREMARVVLNGQDLGIVWTPPFRVNVTKAIKSQGNELKVDVVNFWPNRIIGDDALPKEQRLTRTNIRKLTKETALMPSGLMGPVQLVTPR